jgi:hypothetical protein
MKMKYIILAGLAIFILGIAASFYFIFLSGPPPTVNESEVEIIWGLDEKVKVFFATAFPPVLTQSTKFSSGEAIYPQEEGLSKGTVYAFRVVDRNGTVVVPLDQYPYAEIRVGSGIEGAGQFNSEQNPINPGDYTLQLVKIDKGSKKAFIIAAKNFSIESKYTEEELSNLRAWLVLGEDPNSAHFETLQFNAPGSFSVWVQSTGYSISGKSTTSRIQPNGEKDTSYYRESRFTTDPSGKPVKVFSGSGNFYPGNYPVEIIVEGKVIKQLMVSWY